MDYRKILLEAMGEKGYVLAAVLARRIGSKTECSKAHRVYELMRKEPRELLKYKNGEHQAAPTAYVLPKNANEFEREYPNFKKQ